METKFREFLFSKGYLIGESNTDGADIMAVMTLLGSKYGIKIVSGIQYVSLRILEDAAEFLGKPSALPFYQGFPKSVMELTPDQFLLDQLYAYTKTYGFGWFSETTHSAMEKKEAFERIAFKEDVKPREIRVIPNDTAWNTLTDEVCKMLSGSRPLSQSHYDIVLFITKTIAVNSSTILPTNIPCKDTVVKLYYDTRMPCFLKYMKLPDVIKLLSYISFSQYGNENLKKLNLKNQDRKLLNQAINELASDKIAEADFLVLIQECFEKRQIWCGLLHHIHFQPKTRHASMFAHEIRESRSNLSYMSLFEFAMNKMGPVHATASLACSKGYSAVLRNLDYIISRCKSQAEIREIMSSIMASGELNPVVLIQLYLKYRQASSDDTEARTFTFPRNGRMIVHEETEEEKTRRKTRLDYATLEYLSSAIRSMLDKTLKGRAKGKVYIDPDMYNMAVPLSEASGNGGIGTMATGSRIDIPYGKKIRSFTYWEKVNDVDLSCVAMSSDGKNTEEFSWRTYWNKVGSEAIIFSGDETSGYNGGSEYFDINVEEFRNEFPEYRYLVFCDNIYTDDQCFDTLPIYAGYMLRDWTDSGEIYEPKTVQSKYRLQGDSTFTYMYAIDLYERTIIWLNMNRKGNIHVAGTTDMGFLMKWINTVCFMNVGLLFGMIAEDQTTNPKEADVIVSDKDILERKAESTVIRSNDFGKIMSYLN